MILVYFEIVRRGVGPWSQLVNNNNIYVLSAREEMVDNDNITDYHYGQFNCKINRPHTSLSRPKKG